MNVCKNLKIGITKKGAIYVHRICDKSCKNDHVGLSEGIDKGKYFCREALGLRSDGTKMKEEKCSRVDCRYLHNEKLREIIRQTRYEKVRERLCLLYAAKRPDKKMTIQRRAMPNPIESLNPLLCRPNKGQTQITDLPGDIIRLIYSGLTDEWTCHTKFCVGCHKIHGNKRQHPYAQMSRTCQKFRKSLSIIRNKEIERSLVPSTQNMSANLSISTFEFEPFKMNANLMKFRTEIKKTQILMLNKEVQVTPSGRVHGTSVHTCHDVPNADTVEITCDCGQYQAYTFYREGKKTAEYLVLEKSDILYDSKYKLVNANGSIEVFDIETSKKIYTATGEKVEYYSNTTKATVKMNGTKECEYIDDEGTLRASRTVGKNSGLIRTYYPDGRKEIVMSWNQGYRYIQMFSKRGIQIVSVENEGFDYVTLKSTLEGLPDFFFTK